MLLEHQQFIEIFTFPLYRIYDTYLMENSITLVKINLVNWMAQKWEINIVRLLNTWQIYAYNLQQNIFSKVSMYKML